MRTQILLIIIICIVSCTVKKTDSVADSNREKNIAVVKEINKAIETGDVSKLDQYIAADAIDHASPVGDIKGLDSIKASLARIHTMGKNMKMETIKTVADDEYVFEWMRLTGITATADWGMPVGTAYDFTAIQVSKFKDGKAVEHWEFMQPADMIRMMNGQENKPSKIDTLVVDSVKRL